MSEKFERELTINYRWNNFDLSDIKESHKEYLEEDALNHVFEMIRNGFTSGELHTYIKTDDEDSEDGIKYHGWWFIITRTK